MARTLTISYGTLSVGLTQSNAAFYLTDKYPIDLDYERGRLGFTVVVSAATAAAHDTAVGVLLAAVRDPDQAITVTVGGTRHTFDPSSNTGFLSRAKATKRGTLTDTALSSEWDIVITWELPADNSGDAGRRAARVQVTADASGRRVAEFSGTYTALSSNTALAQYQAEIDTFCDGHLTSLTGTWGEPVVDDFDYEHRNKLIEFRRRYEEIVFNESASGANSTSIAEARITVTRRAFGDRQATVFAAAASPFDFVTLTYTGAIRKAVTTDIDAVYEGEIRPLLLAQVKDGLSIQREDVTKSLDGNRIAVQISGRALKSGVIASRVVVKLTDSLGQVLLPVWDGNPYSRRRYQDIADQVATVSVDILETAPGLNVDPRDAIPPFPDFVEVYNDAELDEHSVGTEENPILLVASRHTFVLVRADEPSTGGGGGGGGTVADDQAPGADGTIGAQTFEERSASIANSLQSNPIFQRAQQNTGIQ